MADANHPTRVSMPQNAKKGEIIEIKTLIQHDMETGYRRDEKGQVIPRDIIVRFEARYGADVIFSAETFPGIAANPYLAFSTVATETADLSFTWTDLNGATTTALRKLTVA